MRTLTFRSLTLILDVTLTESVPVPADTLPNASETASGINYVETSTTITAKPAPTPPHAFGDDAAASERRAHGGPHPPPPPPAPVPLLGLLTNETELSLRVFTDGPGKSIEVYWMGGRKVHTAVSGVADHGALKEEDALGTRRGQASGDAFCDF